MSEPNEQLIQTPGVFGENGNFLLERELGRGGMGGVYMGRDKMLDRPVAVKVMLREYGDDPEFVEKFKREAQAAARLIHPNIAQIYSYGISDGMPYIAMELVAGGSLDSLMRHSPGTMEVPRVMKICEQVAQALRCAADQGLVHGDVKPENILLDANGNAKLVDFGLAGMQKDTDEIWGTPYYISPEKVQRQAVDYRADMYSLGGTLYHALTGVAPFEGEDANAVVRKRFDGMPRKPSEIRPGLSPEIDALVMTMLAFNRDDRFPSFEALVEEFKKVMTVGLGMTQTMKTLSRPTSDGASGGGTVKRMTVKRRNATIKRSRPPRAADASGGDIPEIPVEIQTEGEESGGIVGKVIAVILGVFLVVGGIGGFLWWYVNHDKVVRENADVQDIARGIDKARAAIANTRQVAGKWSDEFAAFAQQASDECEKTTSRVRELLPEFASLLKPAETQELLEARKLENPVAENSAEGASAAPQDASAPAESASPTNDTASTAARVEATPAPAEAKEIPTVVRDVNELWQRAYSCQASAIRIRVGIAKVLAECDKEAEIKDMSRESMERLGKLSSDVFEMYDGLKASKDVENVQKGLGFIKSKGEKLVRQTINRLTTEKGEREREEKAAREREERERLAKEAAEAHARLIETEKGLAKEKFQGLVEAKTLQLLQWETAVRSLEFLRQDLKTQEGKLAVDDELRKVRSMKSVQEIFVRNLNGYAFKRAGLAKLGCVVRDVDMDELKLLKRSDKKPMKLTWSKLYREYQGNLNELINTFVVDGRKNGNPKLNLRGWADAMCGAALSMTIICSDNAGAVSRGAELAKMVYVAYPEYQKYVQVMFPDIDFSGAEASAE